MSHWTITLGGTTLYDPTSSAIEPVWDSVDNLTVNGLNRRKILNRKYRYTLSYEYLATSDYNALETMVNTLQPLTLIYDKFPQAESPGVSVLAELSTREIKSYKGTTDYYSGVNLTLTEVDGR